ncbi:MAG: PH domain-containing protein [Sumerlaeia bacterium]
MADSAKVFAIERPHVNLIKLYILRSCILPPLSFIGLPLLYFRYHTMRYRFDDEGIGMKWGILFRREVNLTYARIQDIHITAGPVQRWLGLADIHIQTASGSAAAEMTIEGLQEFEEIRDFLYEKMRGVKDEKKARAAGELPGAAAGAAAAPGMSPAESTQLVTALAEVRDELRGARAALERLAPGGEG